MAVVVGFVARQLHSGVQEDNHHTILPSNSWSFSMGWSGLPPTPPPPPSPPSPHKWKKGLLLFLTRPIMRIIQVIFLIFLMARMPERLRQQLDFVPNKCLQPNANGHKPLLRQPRHFASLTYSSWSFFFSNTNTQNARTPCPCASY